MHKGCFPELICHDDGVGEGKCCDNFFDVVEFIKLIVSRLGSSIPSEQSYSVVGFATDAAFATDATLTSGRTALDALDALAYTGGRTNHAAATRACHVALQAGEEERSRFLLLVTDSGAPSEPRGAGRDARGEAREAAALARADGVFLVPVLISPRSATSTALALETGTYLRQLSSDGSVLEVSDFGLLGSLEESVLAQVSCVV
jgi:hypothetical protein